VRIFSLSAQYELISRTLAVGAILLPDAIRRGLNRALT
jgi:hypothetical protein